MGPIPLSLYIHFPWCIKKCPYCDFNSHALKGTLPEAEYIQALMENFEKVLPLGQSRPLVSIFMGGGTPSLFSAPALKHLLDELKARYPFTENIEITLEANPGTVERSRFAAYREIGINRISLGIQSFNEDHLKKLGRIHNGEEALQAIAEIKSVGFSNFNLDLMFGLPEQTIDEGLTDLKLAIAQEPSHLSWYELTLEPNTFFWHHPPKLPEDDDIAGLQEQGQALLAQAHYQQYEVSAYSRHQPCQHNVNYWEFGDYLAIGAGSHAKVTDFEKNQVIRWHHYRHPKQYMDLTQGFIQERFIVEPAQLAFEYLLNSLRLKEGVPTKQFAARTGLPLTEIEATLRHAQAQGWLQPFDQRLCTTELGYRYLNEILEIFLPPSLDVIMEEK